jgi:hypothetical protein
VSGEPTGVVDLATSYDEAHEDGEYPLVNYLTAPGEVVVAVFGP